MEIVAERVLEIELPGEAEKRALRVLVGKPEMGDDGAWFAPYEIHGPEDGEVLKQVAYGVDSLQALALALHILPHVVARYERRARLMDHGAPGFNLGVPPVSGGTGV